MDNGATIWIVEDDPSTQRIIAEHLRAHHFVPVLFDTAEKAYAALRAASTKPGTSELPSLIILDMLLPGMSGVDLIRLIKQNGAWEKIPVVVVTVLSREESFGTDPDVNSAFWLNKPFDANNLIQTIQDVLSTVGQREKGS